MTSVGWVRWAGPLLASALFAFAIWVLWRQLAGLDPASVARAFVSLAWWQYVMAGVFLLASFVGYGGLERLASAHFARPLSPLRAFMTGVAAQGLSLTTGKGFLIAGAVRVRLLGRWAFTLSEAIGVTVVVSLHGNAGILALIAVLCAIAGPWWWAPLAAAGAAAGVGAWLVLCWKAKPYVWRHMTIAPPTVPMALRGIAAGGGEKLACVLLALVVQPGTLGIPPLTFLAVMVVSLALARLSQVPGGLGVLEASVLALWPAPLDDAGKASVIAGLLAFRVAYYLVPLAAAVPLLAFLGWRRRVAA